MAAPQHPTGGQRLAAQRPPNGRPAAPVLHAAGERRPGRVRSARPLGARPQSLPPPCPSGSGVSGRRRGGTGLRGAELGAGEPGCPPGCPPGGRRCRPALPARLSLSPAAAGHAWCAGERELGRREVRCEHGGFPPSLPTSPPRVLLARPGAAFLPSLSSEVTLGLLVSTEPRCWM